MITALSKKSSLILAISLISVPEARRKRTSKKAKSQDVGWWNGPIVGSTASEGYWYVGRRSKPTI